MQAKPIRTPAGDRALERASSKKKIAMELWKMPCSKRISSTAVTGLAASLLQKFEDQLKDCSVALNFFRKEPSLRGSTALQGLLLGPIRTAREVWLSVAGRGIAEISAAPSLTASP